MRPYVRRIQLLRPLRPPNRFFTQLPLSRPQLPFLSQPKPTRQVRFLTTERKQWLKGEFLKAGKYTAVLWTATALLLTMAFGAQQEWLERKFPSPHEWNWWTRMNYRRARWNECHGDEDTPDPVDWALVGGTYRALLRRLEDPDLDGAGLEEQSEGGILVEGIGRTGYDITKKPESWRRGYHEVLMGAARAAEYLDGWVVDRNRKIVFPSNVVIGPSNLNPRPVPPGAHFAPREEDCEPAFEPPETYYMRVLTTQGFTERQKLDAALGYAAWLDYKGTHNAAEAMYKWALDIATSSTPNPSSLIDMQTGQISPTAGPVSSNILAASTALAIHHARTLNLNLALPLFLSVLRSRRQLPADKPTMRSTLIPDSEDEPSTSAGIIATARNLITSILAPPKYPPPPPDGTSPPPRDAKERCEEAALMAYIGEIFYTSNSSTSGREEGLAWTREAVDVAEEELRGRGIADSASGRGKEAKATCRQCLETGLGNWGRMVARLAREERERKTKLGSHEKTSVKSGSWFGLGGAGHDAKEQQKEHEELKGLVTGPAPLGRWEAEELVVQERIRRARDVLASGEMERGWSGLFFM
jgi:hypothetical protein